MRQSLRGVFDGRLGQVGAIPEALMLASLLDYHGCAGTGVKRVLELLVRRTACHLTLALTGEGGVAAACGGG